MLKTLRKLPAMHFAYGIADGFHRCRECCNLIKTEDRGRVTYRCQAYGVSKSQATEWGLNFKACGWLNRPMDGVRPLLHTIIDLEREKEE